MTHAAPSRPAAGWLTTVRAYALLTHATPTIAVVLTTAAFAFIAARGLPPLADLVAIVLAMLGGQIAIGAVNELVDAEIDARVKPAKPIPAGLVMPRGARGLALAGLGLMIVAASRLGWASFALCVAGTAVGLAYSLWFKRSVVAWLPYSVALPLVPIWVFVSLDRFRAELLLLYPLGVLATPAVHLSQSLPDVEADRRAGLRTATTLLGEARAFALCWGALALTAALMFLLAFRWTDEPRPGQIAGALALVLGAVNVARYVVDRDSGVRFCFLLVAATVAILGIGWVLSVSR